LNVGFESETAKKIQPIPSDSGGFVFESLRLAIHYDKRVLIQLDKLIRDKKWGMTKRKLVKNMASQPAHDSDGEAAQSSNKFVNLPFNFFAIRHTSKQCDNEDGNQYQSVTLHIQFPLRHCSKRFQ